MIFYEVEKYIGGGVDMFEYAIMMFSVSFLLMIISLLINHGKTDLIHDYHQTKVVDKAQYGKAFSKALVVVALAPLLSGIIGLLGDSYWIEMLAVVVLIIGIIIGLICLFVVQKKYNKGIF